MNSRRGGDAIHLGHDQAHEHHGGQRVRFDDPDDYVEGVLAVFRLLQNGYIFEVSQTGPQPTAHLA